MTQPAADVARIEGLAARRVVTCAAGAVTWRTWGTGAPVVLLHGASGSWTHWVRNVRPLGERLRVHVPDMPGFGESDAPPEPHTAHGLADLVAAAIDAALPAPAPFDLAGFSFGGIIAGLVAARLGSRVGTLVLLGAGGFDLPRAPLPPLLRLERTMTADEVEDVHRQNLGRLMFGDPRNVDDLAVRLQMENIRRTRFKSAGIPESDVLSRALPAIRARLAGIWGGRDAFVGPHVEARRHALAAVQPDVDVRVVAGAGHWVTYEAADAVNAALLDMLGAG